MLMTRKSLPFLIILTVLIAVWAMITTFKAHDSDTERQNITNSNEVFSVTNPQQTKKDVSMENTDGLTNIGEDFSSVVDTSDWNTYRNEEFGFAFKYPRSGQIELLDQKESQLTIKFSQLSSEDIVVHSQNVFINVFRNPKELDIEEKFKEFDDTSKFWFSTFRHQKFKTDEKETVKFDIFQESKDQPFRKVCIVSKNKLIIVASEIFEYKNNHNNLIFEELMKGLTIY